MTEAEFNQIWVPRIGARAAAQLRLSGNLILAVLPMIFACGIALGALDGLSATFTLVFWIAGALVSIATFGVWLHGRIVLARELSHWFGRKLSWFQLPPLRPASFDAWCKRLRLQGPAEHSAGEVVSVSEPGVGTR
ncbi:MAG: hypothetical protein ACLP0J_27195 [Solirubrobacteraceae bacterium]